jgi:hypothetical protein
MVRGRALGIVALPWVLAAALLGSCRRGGVEEQDVRRNVVGTWINPDGALLTVEEDGTFLARGLPPEVFGPLDREGDVLDGDGTWELREVEWGWALELRFPSLAGSSAFYAPLYVSTDREHPYLYCWEGDPDGAEYRLKRSASHGD